MNNWLKIIQPCVLCLQPCRREIMLCEACETTLPWLKTPLTQASVPIQALFEYQWPVDAFIGQLKYKGKLPFAKLLGSLMAQKLKPLQPIDYLVPMPLHPKRQQERGFNQTLVLATEIAKKHPIPIARWSCQRQHNTISQSALSAHKRGRNLNASVFKIAPTLLGKSVLVIEDVITTGATLQAFTTALKKAGVRAIEVWACCQTLRQTVSSSDEKK